MCELFGISAGHEVEAGEWLRTFFTHSNKNPHGWGIAAFNESPGGHVVSSAMEKEPVRADRSDYLKARLRRGVHASTLIAHIREATIGALEYCNTHPFQRQDNSGRQWTLAHNGTVFDGTLLRPYLERQEGQTDSERVLLYIVDRMNQALAAAPGEGLSDLDRCRIVDEAVKALAPENKLNLLLYDGEILYTHTNLHGTLNRCSVGDAVLFATVPFMTGCSSRWEEMPFTSVCAYRDGREIYHGRPHGCAYVENPEMIRSLLMAYAAL